jgi:hypothetical protein
MGAEWFIASRNRHGQSTNGEHDQNKKSKLPFVLGKTREHCVYPPPEAKVAGGFG